MGNSPAIYGGSRTKILTSKGLLLKDGTPIDYNGPKNYITKGTFATNATTGWSLKRTTLSGLIPNQVAASWTTPSVLTLSATTTGALTNSGYSLSLAASAATTAGDMLVSDAYTIDIEDQAKVLNFKFSYKAYANASNMNFSGTSSNTLHVYIYDVTNNAWIQPAGCYTMVQNSGVGIGYGTFQTPSNMTQFRIAIVSCNASSGAFTMYFDNVFVGPQQFNMGPPVTDWVSFTPTWTASVTNPTIGNGSISGWYRREGDTGFYRVVISLGTTSNVGSGAYFIGLPSGQSIDATKQSNTADLTNFGTGRILDSGANIYYGTVHFASSTTVTMRYFTTDAGTNPVKVSNVNAWTNTAPFSMGNADGFVLEFSAPISGWSSNTVMSSDAATNVVAMRAKINASQTPGATYAARANILFADKVYDTNSAYNTTTGQYTVPVSGYYRVTASANFNHTGVVGNAFALLIQTGSTGSSGSAVTESLALESVAASGRQMVLNTSATIKVDAGSTINIAAYDTNTSPSIANNGLQGYLLIERISGPAQIAASETVALNRGHSTGQSIPTAAVTYVDFNSANLDTHSMWQAGSGYNSTTGTWTVDPCIKIPSSGVYEISAHVLYGISSIVTGQYSISFNIDGQFKAEVGNFPLTTGSTYLSTGTVVYSGKLNAGSIIKIAVFQNSGTNKSILNSATWSWVNLKRVGI